jgi:D-alanine-D-alanine ligase-like ATP-grasp enzyme/acylphosphatase
MRLRRAGVPVPMGRTFAHGDFDSARAFAERIGYPVVVKPATGVRGIGVVANIRDQRELQAAFDQLVSSRLGRDDFIVEQHINGGDYRIVVIGDEVIAAVLREPASVEGDGEHTVAELMVNKNVFRRLNPHLWGRPIKYETAARYQLRRAGLRLTSIPERGQKVILSNTCSLSQGGDSIDVLDELHPTIKKACLEAVKAVPGLWFCGIDFLLEDHTKPLAEQEAGICELNAHAAIGNCEYPLYGMPRQVARTVMLQCAEHFGLHGNGKPADSLALRLTIRNRARATQERYSAWLRRHARSFGLSGWVRRVDAETVEAVLVGDAVPVSVLAAAAVLGPRGVRPNWVSTEHITPPKTDGFEILRRKPKEWADAR